MTVASQFLKKIWILIKITIAVLLCTALVINLYLIWAQISNKSSLPKIFGFAQVIVISGSMEPAMEAGDLIIIKEQKKYEKNDIVTYRENNILITHRIIETNQSETVTKGDANNTSDKPILQSDIEGKVILHLPGAGNIVLLLRKPTGILAVSCMVLLLYLISRRDQSHRLRKIKG